MSGTKIPSRRLRYKGIVGRQGCCVALLIAPLLSGCVRNNAEPQDPGVDYALQTAPRPPQPKNKTKNQKLVPPRPHPRPPQIPLPPGGSGDAIPAAATIYLKPGAAIGGLAGAIWADRNNDGYVDGYTYNGQYFAGAPAGYDPTLGRVATGAVAGAALGAAAGAVIPGVSVIQGAVIGAAVGGLPGAVWADRNNDGYVDGYIYNGQYYPGPPPAAVPAPATSGERG